MTYASAPGSSGGSVGDWLQVNYLTASQEICLWRCFVPQVDLGCEIDVYHVTLYLRRECCFNRNHYIEVRVSTVEAEVDAKAGSLVGDTGTAVNNLVNYQVDILGAKPIFFELRVQLISF